MRISYLVLAGAAVSAAASGVASAAPAPSKAGATGALKGQAADPVPHFGPQPAWVVDTRAPPIDPKRKDEPLQFLLSHSYEHLTASSLEHFVEYVVQPLNQAGLQAIGNVTIPWNAARTELTLNRVTIEREGKSLDALKRDDVSVIRRETQLDRSTLTGIRTVVLPVRGLQVGDRLRVAFTYKTRPNMLGKGEEVQDMKVPVPVGRVVRRIAVSKDLPVRWLVDPAVKDAGLKESELGIERMFVEDNAEPVKKRSFLPERFNHRLIQVSAFRNWGEVAAILAPMFDTARKTAANSEVTALADKIAAAHKDPRDRLLAALRTSQNDVRYVALLLGDGDYRPMSADEVWAQRYGDCKGKTALLLALLDRLGIAAEPVLASVTYDDMMGQRLPTLAMFDHVYVRARVGSDSYYLDGTQFGQRTLDEIRQGTTVHILPLVANATLERIADSLPSAPLAETALTWDARNGVTGKVPFEAVLTLRGTAAADMRVELAGSSDREKMIEKLKDNVSGVANDALEFVSSDPDDPDGSYVARFKGSIELDWTPVEGMKGNRLQLTQSPLMWDGEFDRDDAGGKAIPVVMAFPFWQRTVEKVILPDGGKNFELDAKPINQTVAATQMTRTVSMSGGIVTSISDFKRLQRELDGASAAAAKPALETISKEFGYVVARKRIKQPN